MPLRDTCTGKQMVGGGSQPANRQARVGCVCALLGEVKRVVQAGKQAGRHAGHQQGRAGLYLGAVCASPALEALAAPHVAHAVTGAGVEVPALIHGVHGTRQAGAAALRGANRHHMAQRGQPAGRWVGEVGSAVS